MKIKAISLQLYRAFTLLTIVACGVSNARGVSPYLPMNLDPSLQASIERVFLLADRPVMTRPIALSQILDSLPAACTIDQDTCLQVRTYLSRFMKDLGISEADLQLSTSSGSSEQTLPNQHGASINDNLIGNISAFYQPSDYLIFNLGASINGELTPNATYLSAGWDIAQLDIGYRDIWLSPFSGHSFLLSTEARTMPSISISNYKPISPINLQYQVSLSTMSKSDHIRYLDDYTSGYPNLAGIRLETEPTSGFSIAVNRLLQYGGGARGSSGGLNGFFGALLDPSHRDNTLHPTYSADQEFGNQIASLNFEQILPTNYPTKIYTEYSGDDTLNGSNWKLGNIAASLGITVSNWNNLLDLTLEISEWQNNNWSSHGIYQDGLTNDGNLIGSWFGDQRYAQDNVGGSSYFVQTGWHTKRGYLQTKYRTLSNQDYGPHIYHRSHEFGLGYSFPYLDNTLNTELLFGSDVFGKKYTRLSATYRLGLPYIYSFSAEQPDNKLTHIFLDYGISQTSPRIVYGDDTYGFKPIRGNTERGPHTGLGIRRKISNNYDLGMRLELDRVSGRQLLSLRTIDWRYRFENSIAASLFLGFARYDWRLPAYGYYGGLGFQWLKALPNTDLNFDLKFYNKIARDKLLTDDPSSTLIPDMFNDIDGAAIYFSHDF